jgi:carbamoyltransferase
MMQLNSAFTGGFAVMPRRQRFYIGLAASLHDPAVAILAPDGTPLFAEANERYLQNKRAYQCPPDDLIRIPRIVGEICPPDAELVVAISWSNQMLQRLQMAGLSGISGPGTLQPQQARPGIARRELDPELLFVGIRNSLSQAGLNLKASNRVPNPVLLRRYDHHLTHAALAAFTSPFEECAVAVIDGYGENRSTSFYRFLDRRLTAVAGQGWDSPIEMHQHISLGHLYSRLCTLCGFDPVLGEEWKVMGLAGHGSHDPRIYELLRTFIRIQGLTLRAGMSNDEYSQRLQQLSGYARSRDVSHEAAADLAATGQQVFEELVMKLLAELYRQVPSSNLVLCGGCALNSSCNGKILDQSAFDCLHVPSAPGDDGCALGAALLAFVEDNPRGIPTDELSSPYLGSSISAPALDRLQRLGGMPLSRLAPSSLTEEVARLLADGQIVGWVRGQAEFGPRALGHRSILADPRRPDMKDRINSQVKFREDFRPFAPAILDEHGEDFFDGYQTSRYMERTQPFRTERAAEVPAVVHIDGTGRLQSVRSEWSPTFHALIRAFYDHTGCPLILNTSLNVMGKPIAHSLEDALGVFLTTGLDVLVVEDVLMRKSELSGD